jgi:hypothetical protein
MDNLKFRRQYIITNKEIGCPANWKRLKIQQDRVKWHLYSHPDLEINRVKNKYLELLLIGYFIDPENPELTNSKLLKKISLLKDFNRIIRTTDNFNGRFVLIYSDKKNLKIYNDATGFREVYYYFKNGSVCCGSTPNIIAQYFKTEKGADREMSIFFTSKSFNNGERIWIGDDTIYEGIKHLLPNHYVDLIKKSKIRFWPYKDFFRTELSDAVIKISEILKGTYKSALSRYKLHQGLTAGWDTRLLLAASKDYVNDINYYIYKTSDTSEKSYDIKISKKLSRKFNVPFNIINIEDNDIDDTFSEIFYRNNVLARSKLINAIYHAYKNRLDDTLTVSGTMGNEILRILLRTGKNKPVNAEEIAVKLNYGQYKYVVNAIQKWLEETLPVSQKLNYNIMDLFSWEQVFGNWGALSGSEQDIVRDEIRPFNNRNLLSTFASLDDKYRYKDYPVGYIKIIKYLWKDILKVPAYRSGASGHFIRKILRLLSIEQKTEQFYRRIKSKRIK